MTWPTDKLYVLDRMPNSKWRLLEPDKRDWEIDFLQRHIISDTNVAEKMQDDSRPAFVDFENGQYSFITLYKFYRMVVGKES